MLESLILQWGYIILLAGTLLEGESILLAAGALAHKGLLHLPIVIIVAAVGGFSGDVIWYFLGRKFGLPFLEKRPKLAGHMDSVRRYSDRFGGFFVIAMRFIYGIRTAAPVFLGATRYPMIPYLLYNAIGAIVWANLIAFLGYQLGIGFRELLSRHPHIEEILIATVIGVVLFMIVRHGYHYWKARQAMKKPEDPIKEL